MALMPRTLRSRIVAPVVVAVGLAGLAIAWFADPRWARAAAMIALTAVVGALLVHLRRVTSLAREEAGRWRAETAPLRAQLDRVEERLERTERRVDALVESVEQLPGQLTGSSAEAAREANRGLAGWVQRGVYARVAAHADLRALVRPRAPMPPLDDWALDADIMHLVARLLWAHDPALIVECGSGSSSVWLGYLAELRGNGRVVALEHDPGYLRTSRELVRLHGLQDRVDVRHAPLDDWRDESGDRYRWYAQAALEDLTGIGMLLVDGPPGTTGRQARYPAVPLLLPRCADQAVIILDDANRPDEHATSDRWLAERPELTKNSHCQERAHVFVRAAGRQPG